MEEKTLYLTEGGRLVKELDVALSDQQIPIGSRVFDDAEVAYTVVHFERDIVDGQLIVKVKVSPAGA